MDGPKPGEYWWVYYQDEWQPAQCDDDGQHWLLCGLDIAVEVEHIAYEIEMEI